MLGWVDRALVAIIAWIAVNWVLAIAHALTRSNLTIAAVLFVIAAIWIFTRIPPAPRPLRPAPLLAYVPIAFWCAFVLWRGYVVPPASHDALTYHLPKAVMIVRAHGYTHFDVPDPRIRTFPSNYELLLADVLILTGSDRVTEWIGTAFYVLFLGVVAMVARRWWGEGLHVTACVLTAAGAPLLLLHSGHDKNDLMTAVFAAAALYWASAWCVRRGAVPAMMAIACGVTAIGTKMSAAAIVIGIAPFGIAALVRRPPRVKPFAGAVLFAALALLFCGGWVFVQNARSPAAPHVAAGGLPTSQYGEWSHLWEVPYLSIRASLGLKTKWPWPAENLFSSHYGPVFALVALALPFCVWRYRGDRERAIAGIAAAVAFFVLLPLVQYPQIALPSILRYTAFILPVLYGWTIAPLLRGSKYAPLAIGALMVIFAVNAFDIAYNDTLAPLAYARWCAAHPGTRQIFWSENHAEIVADLLAGPHDTIAIRAGRNTWIYPAYGAHLTRTVIFVEDKVPDSAQWVAVDAEDPRFVDALARDPRFELVYRRGEQALFHRRDR